LNCYKQFKGVYAAGEGRIRRTLLGEQCNV
jgi:hypothetical protein